MPSRQSARLGSFIYLNILFMWFDDIEYQKIKWKRFRGKSSSFIAKKDIRETVFKRDSYSCVECESKYKLQIDHILSVYRCFVDNRQNDCNILNNLQTICLYCNAGKKP